MVLLNLMFMQEGGRTVEVIDYSSPSVPAEGDIVAVEDDKERLEGVVTLREWLFGPRGLATVMVSVKVNGE